MAHMNGAMLARFGIARGDLVRLSADGTTALQGFRAKSDLFDVTEGVRDSASESMSATLYAKLDANLPDNVVRIASGHINTVSAGPMFTLLRVAKA
jgi:hypothetical protein